jgi:hypothetical protein
MPGLNTQAAFSGRIGILFNRLQAIGVSAGLTVAKQGKHGTGAAAIKGCIFITA